MKFRDYLIVFLTLLFWLEFTVVIVLGIKLGWNVFHKPAEAQKTILTPGMIKTGM